MDDGRAGQRSPLRRKDWPSGRTRAGPRLGGGLLLLVTLLAGYLFLTDEEQPAGLIAGFYRLIGFGSEADAIEEFGSTRSCPS